MNDIFTIAAVTRFIVIVSSTCVNVCTKLNLNNTDNNTCVSGIRGCPLTGGLFVPRKYFDISPPISLLQYVVLWHWSLMESCAECKKSYVGKVWWWCLQLNSKIILHLLLYTVKAFDLRSLTMELNNRDTFTYDFEPTNWKWCEHTSVRFFLCVQCRCFVIVFSILSLRCVMKLFYFWLNLLNFTAALFPKSIKLPTKNLTKMHWKCLNILWILNERHWEVYMNNVGYYFFAKCCKSWHIFTDKISKCRCILSQYLQYNVFLPVSPLSAAPMSRP